MIKYYVSPIVSMFKTQCWYWISIIAVGYFLFGCAGKYDIQPLPQTPAPAILSLTPDCGRMGDTLTLLGHNFSSVASKNELTINGTRLAVIASDTNYITAVVPPNAGSNNMIIIVSGKTGIGPYFSNSSTGLISNYVSDISALGIMADKNGDIYWADPQNNRVRRYTKSGSRDFIAGNGLTAFIDGNGSNAYFNYPMDVAVDSKGNIFVTDNSNSCIRKINTNGDVSLYAGKRGYLRTIAFPVPGYQDGVRTEAMFKHPTGITIDKFDNLFVCDAGNNRIRKITPDGVNSVGEVTTVAGNGEYGNLNGNALEASFSYLIDLVVDSVGNIYLIEQDADKVRKISTNNLVTTIIERSNTPYSECNNNKTYFQFPAGIAIDKKGMLLVSMRMEEMNYKIITVSPNIAINTLVGGKINGPTEGMGTDVWMSDAGSLTFFGNDLFAASNYSIMKVEIK